MARSPSKKHKIAGQPSWRLATAEVEAYVTELGGQVAPVTFDIGGRKIAPYSIPPWAEEKPMAGIPAILQVLRGDFFCMPFGHNDNPYRGEVYPPHGEPANSPWHFEALTTTADRTCLHLSMDTTIRRGRVDKRICLVPGHHAIYSQHVVSGMKGPMNPGHHATLRFPDKPGSGHISTSRRLHGQVFVAPVELPENRGYSLLKPGATFRSLKKVPTITGDTTDLSRYPARRGYEDVVIVVADPAEPFAWTAAVFPAEGYVWFALKDPRVLRFTQFWLSNGGRHYPPWNGRHVNVMGLEEITSFFHPGLAESARPNALSRAGYPTTLQLDPKKPLVVNYIMAVAAIPRGFDEVATIRAARAGNEVTLRATGGQSITVPLDVNFLQSPALG